MGEATKVTIDVTAEDIENGRRYDGCKCPIALAATRAGLADPNVSKTDVFFGPQRGRDCISLPPRARKFVVDYDNDGLAEPFTFEISVWKSAS